MLSPLPYPFFDKISIECNSYCNRTCSFCTRTNANREKARMPEELVYKVLYELAEINYKGLISFHFYNEIFTDKRIFSFFEKSQELGLSNYIFTNGDYLTKDIIERLSGFNIKEFTVSIYDWQTADDYIAKCEELNNNLGIASYPWRFKTIQGGGLDFGNRAGYVQHKAEYIPLPIKAGCSKIEEKVDIKYDGTVVMCCMDYYGIHPIGNIANQNIVEIWYGETKRKHVEDLRKGLRDCYKLCSKCSDYLVKL